MGRKCFSGRLLTHLIASGWHIAMHLHVDLAHGDGERAATIFDGGLSLCWEGQSIDEGCQLKHVQARFDWFRRGASGSSLWGRHMHARHVLREGLTSLVQQAESCSLFKKGAPG